MPVEPRDALEFEDITDTIRSLEGARDVFAEIVFTSVTPYWGGGYTGKTFHCVDGECSDYEFLWQGSEQLRGMLRWLARTAVASYISDEDLGKNGYKATEDDLLRKLFGSVEKNARAASFILEARLESRPEPFAEYKTIVAAVQEAFDEAKKRIERRGDRSKSKQSPRLRQSHVMQVLEEKAYRRLRLGQCGDDDFICLFTVPRFHLLALGVEAKPESRDFVNKTAQYLFELQPAKPGTVVFRLRLRERPGAKLEPAEKFLLASLALAEPVLLGLGKSVSRGFGRFLPRRGSYRFDTGDGDFNGELAEVAEKLATKPDKSTIEQLINLVLKATAKAWGISHEPYKSLASVPRLSYAHKEMRYVEQLKHPCMLATREYAPRKNDHEGRQLVLDYCNPSKKKPVVGVLEALSAVGKAATKAVWKIYYYSYLASNKLPSGLAVKMPGVGFHTWILGLPRQQCQKVKQKAKQYRKCRGYAIGNIKVNRILKCMRNEPKDLEAGRRISNVIISVLPGRKGYAGVILPLTAAIDIPNALKRDPSKARLLHVGEHSKGKIIVVTDVEAVSSLQYIIPHQYDPQCGKWAKPMDAGIIEPGQHNNGYNANSKEFVENILHATFDWLETLLN
ncbi:RAMP superfamily [Pyrodictium delaneyi]|uniref:RAMP superfamily n=1 Tax=Pyrodictium delaneyi TaxID=1273541 RepID=A0A0P0N4B3_9CREN|nr:RAMP superfamily CRISPR-associated protein [Pyrodictium delaneyi]ALL01405.1 RAMP superfamily [Pyrodictium delaneyi]OWJ54496.1 hypothetical protein Pdsh_06785 [Pyrodictium delaneyi]OWJ54676.1 hypothetical protein Pdsh_06570 [Pyrodictium delaneyi]